jgi:hypothetical protein
MPEEYPEHGEPERPATGSAEEVGRQRLRDALMRPSRGQAVVGVLLAVLGFAAITQVRTNTTDNTYAGYREQDLVDVLSGLAGTSQRAQLEINRLEATARDLEARRRGATVALNAAQKQEQELSILAGWVPVTGPGIRLTVTEGPQRRPCRSTARSGWSPRAPCSRPPAAWSSTALCSARRSSSMRSVTRTPWRERSA